MTKHSLKNMTATLFFTLNILGSSTVSTAQVIENTSVKTEVKLTSRYTGGDYSTASYSFKFLSQDSIITENNTEILFEGREDSKDYFSVRMSVGDHSLIYDLGKRSCKDIQSTNTKLRSRSPLAWLASSEANPSKLTPAITAVVEGGHCYLVYNSDESGRLVALFHVAEHNKSYSVKINEIEVLEKTFLSN